MFEPILIPKQITIVNRGERSITVPETALKPDTPEGREYWEMVVGGSVSLSDEALDTLLSMPNDQEGKTQK